MSRQGLNNTNAATSASDKSEKKAGGNTARNSIIVLGLMLSLLLILGVSSTLHVLEIIETELHLVVLGLGLATIGAKVYLDYRDEKKAAAAEGKDKLEAKQLEQQPSITKANAQEEKKQQEHKDSTPPPLHTESLPKSNVSHLEEQKNRDNGNNPVQSYNV
jgi:hypothetical protein